MLKAILGLLLAPLILMVVSGVALADADPETTIIEADGFQCLLTPTAATTAACDMLILIRYDLDKVTWRIDVDDISPPAITVEYMAEADCLDGDEQNLLGLCHTSLKSGIVTHTFYNGAFGASLIGARTPPRVGDGISAIYVAAGHSLTFGTATYETCLEPASTVFSPATPACSVINWHTVTDADADGLVYDDAQGINAPVLVNIMENLERATPDPELLTTNGKITPLGQFPYTDEAFSGWPLAAPDAFAIVQLEQASFAAPTADTALETAVKAEASGTYLDGLITGFVTDRVPGVSKQLVGTVFFLILSAGLALAILNWLGRGFGVFAAGLTIWAVMTTGMLTDMVDANLYWIILLIFASLGLFDYLRDKFPA